MSGHSDRDADPLAHRRDHRHRDRRLCRELALPPLVEGSVLRPHRLLRRTGGHRRRRLRAAVHPRYHAGQHERAADADRAREAATRSSPSDRMRVDIEADFYVRVPPTREAVSIAAATLGRRTMEPERLHALLSGKFVSALRSVASEMTMEQMHEQRGEYVARVKAAAAEALAQNGLELEIGGHHRSRPDRPRILQSVEPLRRGRSDPADRGHRGPPQAAQRHRAGLDDQDPHPQPRSRAAGARHRARERDRASRSGARHRGAARGAARRSRPRARARATPRPSRRRSPPARRSKKRASPTSRRSRSAHRFRAGNPPARDRAHEGGRGGGDRRARGRREGAHRQNQRRGRGAHRVRARRSSATRDRAHAHRRGGRDRRARDGRESADRSGARRHRSAHRAARRRHAAARSSARARWRKRRSPPAKRPRRRASRR